MKNAILALLAKEPAHGYELKQALTDTFGELWPPINDGQIYTTLARLERDGLVKAVDVPQAARPTKRVFELTQEGRAEVVRWLDQVAPAARVRDGFFTKVLLAERAGADPLTLIDRQRRAYLRRLRELNVLAEQARGDAAALLAIEGVALHLQADLKWLERCEERFTQGGER